MTRTPVRGLTAAALGAGMLLLATPAMAHHAEGPASTTEDGTTIIKVRSTETSGQTVGVDGEPIADQDREPKPGERFEFTEDLAQDGEKVGTGAGGCEFLEKANTIDCDFTATFADGTLHVLGEQTFPEEDDSETPFILPVVGGSGDYQGATGTLNILDVENAADPEDVQSYYTLTLTLPAAAQVDTVPAGGAETGGGDVASSSDGVLLLIGLGALAAVAGLGVIAGGRNLPRRR